MGSSDTVAGMCKLIEEVTVNTSEEVTENGIGDGNRSHHG